MADNHTNLFEVAVFLPLRRTFTYEAAKEIQPQIIPGQQVLVPFGRRFLQGIILGPSKEVPKGKEILPICQVLEEDISIPGKMLPFLRWIAHYYLEPIGEVLKAALPGGTAPSGRPYYCLTNLGRSMLKDISAQTTNFDILHFLKNRQGRASGSLLKKNGFSSKKISQMVAAGFITKEKKPILITNEKSNYYIKFFDNKFDIIDQLASREKEILEFIRNQREISLSMFNKKFKNKELILKKLLDLNLVFLEKKEEHRQQSWEELEGWFDGPPSVLNAEQDQVLQRIGKAIQAETYHPFLLFGVTGSGKTEIYLRAIEQVIARGSQALLLVPEIALTAQMIAYFRQRIALPIAVVHSSLSRKDRLDTFRRIRRNQVSLVVGARSAIFAPLGRLKMIIVDEEHDPSYKQEEKLRYNARDLALVRGRMEDAVVILGSATPSLESFFNVQEKKIELLHLPSRIEKRPLPEVEVVDMRQEKESGKGWSFLSRRLEESIGNTLARGEQTLLFLNRRGFSTFSLCRDCGFVFRCPNCSVSLVYHRSSRAFRCHYCDHDLPAPQGCPQCLSPRLELFGLGTQRLEEEIQKRFPEARVGRLDRDTASRKQAHQRILHQMRRGNINLLVGTQMIAKGHDLPRVTLVGVLAADLSLNIPDFRAAERTFQLLTQVAGRAGRSSWPGKVIIQTYNPDHYSIQMAKQQDFEGFYRKEACFRKEMGYPPFRRLVCLRIEGNSEQRVQQFSEMVAKMAGNLLDREDRFHGKVEILGPSPAPLSRLRGKFRFQILLKGLRWDYLHDFTEIILAQGDKLQKEKMKMTVDVDPVNML